MQCTAIVLHDCRQCGGVRFGRAVLLVPSLVRRNEPERLFGVPPVRSRPLARLPIACNPTRFALPACLYRSS